MSGRILQDLTQGDTATPITLESLMAEMAGLKALLAKAKIKPARTPSTTATDPKAVKEGSKKAQMVELLHRAEGITNEEAKAIFNWPSISVKTQAALLGIPVRFEKVGREKRYFGMTDEAIAAQRDVEATERAREYDDSPLALSGQLAQEALEDDEVEAE